MNSQGILRLAWLLLSIAACSPSSEADAGRSAACLTQDRSLQQALDVARGNSHNAMLAVKNADCGTTVYISGDTKTATQASLWRIHSVTKTFVSAAILSLVKEGTVSLDDPLSRWVPNVPGTTGVTVEMLLDHRSGIFDYRELAVDCSKPWMPQQLVDLATAHAPYFAPDGGFHYSNTNYILLGMILEAATGQKAGAVLHARVIAAAKLSATFFDGFDQVDPSRMARGYHSSTDVTFSNDPSCGWTAGAMVASAGDVAEWVATLYGSSTILDASQRALLSSKTSDFGYPGVTYGLGVEFLDASVLLPEHAGPAMGHGGDDLGFETMAFYFPDKKTAIVAIVNDDATWLLAKSVEQAASALFP